MHRNSLLMFGRYGLPYVTSGSRVLELGPDALPSSYRALADADVAAWDTADFHGRPGMTYALHDPYVFPIDDDAYDVVLSGQVIEHVPKVWRWIGEIARVTRPGGILITVAPVSWPYHEDPHDCWRMYPEGLSALYEDAGLEVLVAEWGSLEVEHFTRRLPAKWRARPLWQRLSTLMLVLNEKVRFPVEGAFDTIVVGRKPM